MEPFVLPLTETNPARVFSAFQAFPYSLLLDSADLGHPGGQYSYILFNPSVVIEYKDGAGFVQSLTKHEAFSDDPFAVLERELATLKDKTTIVPELPPFQGGAAGLFGYDLGRALEELPDTAQDNADIPDMAVGIYEQVIAFDHAANKAWLITHAADEHEARIKQSMALKFMDRGEQQNAITLPFAPIDLNWESNMDADEYEAAITKALDYIYAGEIYQANIAQRFDADLPEGFDAYTHYLRLREVNPAPMASYFNLGGAIISSASPERFLSVSDRHVETQPIKGTRPRMGNATMDKAYREELLSSEKDRAENIMIVDLMRNDLSKVCASHSVTVDKLCALESFASVHHLVSSIHGELEEDKSAVDLLRGCFPGGSITGAPKIRAQEVIEEIEGLRRGPYCGSIGYVGFDGRMDSSILIRTLVYEGNKVSLSVGSGIVADSNADEEYQETFDKAEAMFRSFNGLNYEIEEDYLAVMSAAE